MTPSMGNGGMRGAIPASAGIGLRAGHCEAVLETLPAVGWLEVHSENYFGEGGRALHYLERIREHYPLSLHGVGLSVGSTDCLNRAHLYKLKGLIRRFEPSLVSDHLSWSSVDGRYLNDLLPLPYTEETLAHVVARVTAVQEYLGRPILLENPSSYLEYTLSTMPEWEFLAEAARRTGCGILLDVNNIHVAACNHGFAARRYLEAIPADCVQEIHLAGFLPKRFEEGAVLIDTHNRPVAAAVWDLYREALARFGCRPTLIEWDTDLPPLSALLEEAERAERLLENCHAALA